MDFIFFGFRFCMNMHAGSEEDKTPHSTMGSFTFPGKEHPRNTSFASCFLPKNPVPPRKTCRPSREDSALSDPDMWSGVQSRLGRVIDLFWDDLTVYTETVVFDAKEQMLNRAADHEALSQLGTMPCCSGVGWWRAKLLYCYLPFDVSVFGQIKGPVFWLLTLLSITPMFGIRVAFFTIILLCIIGGRPPDEYQLVTFILTFKGPENRASHGVFTSNVGRDNGGESHAIG